MRNTALVVLFLAVAACDSGFHPVDAGPTDSGGTPDLGTDAGPRDLGVDLGHDAGPTSTDGNDSFATATATTIGAMTAPTGVIDPAGDLDYFSFAGTAGQWIAITTTANAMDDPMKVDTVVTLYDASMTQIAENDDGLPRASTDSELIVHLPATGTYYVLVQEFSTWSHMTPEAHPMDTYTLSIFELTSSSAGVTIDPETGDDVASATALQLTTMHNGIALGLFRDAADVDVYSFSVTAGQLFEIRVMPIGPMGNGSTSGVAPAWVTDDTGTMILARLDTTDMTPTLAPNLAAGSYRLWVQHAASTAGANDFYVGKHFVGMENPPEADDAGNDTEAGAEAITLTAATGATRRDGYVLARRNNATDVDHFTFDLMAGEQAAISCGAATSGSGVRGLHVDLLHGTPSTVVASADETPAMDGAQINASTTTALGAGPVIVRLTYASQDPTVLGDFARCGFHAITPAP